MHKQVILITGAAGFIGTALCSRLSSNNKIVGVDITEESFDRKEIIWEQADLTNNDSIITICEKCSPDVVIHCAGIAHQKIGKVDSTTYMQVNSQTTEHLAKAVLECNPDVRFIFLSSISVYGEDNLAVPVSENSPCCPSSDYARSKLNAEEKLTALFDKAGFIHNLVILRLAPVYDRDWSFNLDRRVLLPLKIAYLRFGSGSQKMSALARPNLFAFIDHILEVLNGADKKNNKDENYVQAPGQNNLFGQSKRWIFNVCDTDPYEFNTIIRVFKESSICPNRPVISIPLFVIWFATRIAGLFFSNKKEWIYSCYDKLASDLIFDNKQMIETGFRPEHSLKTIFLSEPALDKADYN